jgi:RNA polymerase sigma-70 factor (ECF subfamily)
VTTQADNSPLHSEDDSFNDFLRRIRAGEESAAAELVQRYEPALRMEVRLRLGDPKLRRLLEPADICQSVLGSFFVRAASGQFELSSRESLLALLLAMARNKVAIQARRQHAQRRDNRRDVGLDAGALDVAGAGPSPSRMAIGREMLDQFRRRLSPEEMRLADLRTKGYEWAEIAAQVGGTPQARRKQLARAADRVAREIGLDDDGVSDD